MSRGMVCDQCGVTLIVNRHGEDDNGESSAWVRVEIGKYAWDCCTRACAHALLDDPDVIAVVDEYAQIIADIARTIRGEGDDE